MIKHVPHLADRGIFFFADVARNGGWVKATQDRWGEELGAPRTWLTAKISRAGFEPRRGCTTSPGLDRPENDQIMGAARRTHGSNPARSSQGRWYPFSRAEIFAPPILGPIRPFAPRHLSRL
jgi:hypothetical protein